MASSFVDAGLNPAVGAAAGVVVEVSLHTAAPDTSGSNELTGGSYARQPVSWGTPSSGIVTAAVEPEFSVPGGNWVRWCGLWDSSGAWVGGIELDSQVEFPSDGSYTVSPLRLIVESQDV